MDRRPIGVFDSGVGGLTVLKRVRETLPYEDIIYLGDTARVPYGSKSKETVTRFAVECIRFLKRYNIKLLVVACNTASSWSLKTLKQVFRFPIIGVIEPAVKEACAKSRNFKIGIIGTKATVNSGAYPKEIKKLKKPIKIYQKACPLFVPLVEESWLKDKITFSIALRYLRDIKDKNIDTLILGCTHYPLLKGVFKKVLKKGTNIVDSSFSVSREIKAFLKNRNLENKHGRRPRLRFFVTDDPASFKRISRFFLKKDIDVKKVDLT